VLCPELVLNLSNSLSRFRSIHTLIVKKPLIRPHCKLLSKKNRKEPMTKHLCILLCMFTCAHSMSGQTTTIATDTFKLQGRGAAFLSFSLDTQSVMVGTKSQKPLVFKLDSIERFRITTAGYLGIGTSTPTQLVEVTNGNILLSNTNGTPSKLRLQSNTDKYVALIAADSVSVSYRYILPKSKPNSNGMVLASDTNGAMSWAINGGQRAGSAAHGFQTFTQSTTYTVPEGIMLLYVQLWGGGGGGGSDRCGLPGGGGGSGGYVSATVAVVPGEMLDLVIGAGGAGDQTNGGCNCGCDPAGQTGQTTLIKRLSTSTIILSATGGFAGGGACRNGHTGPGAVCAIGTGPGGAGAGGSFVYTRGVGVFISNSTAGNTGDGAAGGVGVCVSGACYGAGDNNMLAGAAGAIAIDW
jgi:hypothetical protein